MELCEREQHASGFQRYLAPQQFFLQTLNDTFLKVILNLACYADIGNASQCTGSCKLLGYIHEKIRGLLMSSSTGFSQ